MVSLVLQNREMPLYCINGTEAYNENETCTGVFIARTTSTLQITQFPFPLFHEITTIYEGTNCFQKSHLYCSCDEKIHVSCTFGWHTFVIFYSNLYSLLNQFDHLQRKKKKKSV